MLLACSGGDSGPTPTPLVRTFDEDDCPFEVENEDVECGWLTVPADRDDPDSEEIELNVAVFEARSRTSEPDPVVYLEGGPGGRVMESVETSFAYLIAPFLDDRDVIVFDQRGVGYSDPVMDCPEIDDVLSEELETDLDVPDYVDASVEAIVECRDRLEDDGVDTGLANSAESAADLDDLRRALGYEEWNLFGVSYGTRLALTAMRDYPEGIRSVILDSTYPPEADLIAETPANFARALAVLFEDCEANSDCRSDYPDLEDTLFEAVEDLHDDPVVVDLSEAGGFFSPLSVDEVVFSDETFLSLLFQLFYVTEFLPSLPDLIFDVADGDYEFAAVLAASFQEQTSGSVDFGMYLSVQCTEEAPFADEEAARAALEEHAELAAAFPGEPEYSFESCEAWGAEAAPGIENEPVESDIPTLVLAGRYDPITPPAWGKAVAERLENGSFLEFPAIGHGVVFSSGCAERIARNFLDDPQDEPGAACFNRLDPPDFGPFLPF